MGMDDKGYTAHLLEEIRDQNRALLEGMKDMPKSWEFKELQRDIDTLRQNGTVIRVAIADVSQDMKIIKAAVTDNTRQVNELEHRVSRLEAA